MSVDLLDIYNTIKHKYPGAQANGRGRILEYHDNGVLVADAYKTEEGWSMRVGPKNVDPVYSIEDSRICRVCRHEWEKRKKAPIKCPACQSKYWETGKPTAVRKTNARE